MNIVFVMCHTAADSCEVQRRDSTNKIYFESTLFAAVLTFHSLDVFARIMCAHLGVVVFHTTLSALYMKEYRTPFYSYTDSVTHTQYIVTAGI